MTPFSVENLLKAGFYIGIIGLIVLVVQFLFYRRLVGGEYSRKLIHILSALWMATWRFDLTHLEVTYLGLLLLFIIFFVKRFNWFNSIFGVERDTYGEASFVVGIILASLLFPNPVVYALAVINLGLADGLAAVIGTRYGHKKYDVFGATKSLIGMFSSFAVVLISGTVFWILVVDLQPSLIFIVTHIIATAAVVSGVEFISFKGLDNIAIPLVTGLLYTNLIVA